MGNEAVREKTNSLYCQSQFASNLEYLLFKKHMTATQLARTVGMSRKTLQNWLSGQSPRDFEKLRSIGNTFGVSVDQLLFSSLSTDDLYDFSSLTTHVFLPEASEVVRYEVSVRRLQSKWLRPHP